MTFQHYLDEGRESSKVCITDGAKSETVGSSQNPHNNQKILCTMHNDGTQGAPCQILRRLGQQPWEEHSFQAFADFSIVIGANRLRILVYVD